MAYVRLNVKNKYYTISFKLTFLIKTMRERQDVSPAVFVVKNSTWHTQCVEYVFDVLRLYFGMGYERHSFRATKIDTKM
jgi:hypothetical protein